MDQKQRARQLAALHVKGQPVVLYNIWDAGSAQVVQATGAAAIATSSRAVANAHGYEDGELIPLDLVLANLQRIVAAVDLPVTADIETGYGATAEAVGKVAARMVATGAVGLNLEDQLLGTKTLRPVQDQADRLSAVRQAADAAGVPLCINARTDLFWLSDAGSHNQAMIDTALERAAAYAQAGADCFFCPGLRDLKLIARLCAKSPLPVNIVRLPDDELSNDDLARAGVARISYGSVPYLRMSAWLKSQLSEV